jgi:hypothetical protein
MTARERVEAMIRTDRGNMTAWSTTEVRNALDAYRAEILATEEFGPASSGDWRQDMETTRLARLAIHALRKAQTADQDAPELPAEQMVALVAEFDRLRATIADCWNTLADKLAAVPHNPTALTGPYWYGQGWDDAVHHVRDLADYVEPDVPATKEQQ